MNKKNESEKSVKFVTPPNMLRTKVGSGGLSEQILRQAEKLLENNSIEFEPIAKMYLEDLYKAIDRAYRSTSLDYEETLQEISYPLVQLRANGKMFRYNLLTKMAEKALHFLKYIKEFDDKSLEIIQAFHTSMNVVVSGKIKGDGGAEGDELLNTLIAASDKYHAKSKNKKK